MDLGYFIILILGIALPLLLIDEVVGSDLALMSEEWSGSVKTLP